MLLCSRHDAVVPDELLPVMCLPWGRELRWQALETWSHQPIATPEMRPEALDLAAANRVKVTEATLGVKFKQSKLDKSATGRQANRPEQAAVSKSGQLSAADHASAQVRSDAAAAALIAEEDAAKAAARRKEEKARRRKQNEKKASCPGVSADVADLGSEPPAAGEHGVAVCQKLDSMQDCIALAKNVRCCT